MGRFWNGESFPGESFKKTPAASQGSSAPKTHRQQPQGMENTAQGIHAKHAEKTRCWLHQAGTGGRLRSEGGSLSQVSVSCCLWAASCSLAQGSDWNVSLSGSSAGTNSPTIDSNVFCVAGQRSGVGGAGLGSNVPSDLGKSPFCRPTLDSRRLGLESSSQWKSPPGHKHSSSTG